MICKLVGCEVIMVKGYLMALTLCYVNCFVIFPHALQIALLLITVCSGTFCIKKTIIARFQTSTTV